MLGPRSHPLLVAFALSLGSGCPANEEAATPKVEETKAAEAPKATAPVKPPEQARPVETDAPPEGWSRLELSSVAAELAGTVDVPPGIEAEFQALSEGDVDGLQAEVPSVKLGAATLRPLVAVPPRFESAKAMLAFHDGFDEVSTHAFGPDHWAVVQLWRPGECMLHGWSKPAGLSCDVFKAPCDEMKQWVDLCGSLRAGDAPNTTETTPHSAFEDLEPAAAEVAMAVARAIARNEPAAIVEATGEAGLTIGKTKIAKADLASAFAGKTVAAVVSPDYASEGAANELYQWNAGDSAADTATIWFGGGYGEQPFFRMRKTGDAWTLTEFGVEDLGEP